MKKGIVLFFALCFIFTSALPSAALQREISDWGIVSPMFTYINLFQTTLDITTSGRADVSVNLYASAADETEVYAYLQQYRNGSWTTIKSWTHSEQGASCSLSNSWYVTSGYTYRVVSYGYVYISGALVESTSITTPGHSY